MAMAAIDFRNEDDIPGARFQGSPTARRAMTRAHRARTATEP
jgi:hypothetical protein